MSRAEALPLHRTRGSLRAALALALVAGLVLAGCTPLALRTAPAPAELCLLALMTGSLEQHPETGLGVRQSDVEVTGVEWPFGYTARMEMSTIALVDEAGNVLAREHDRVKVGGGLGSEPDPVWHACGAVAVESNEGG